MDLHVEREAAATVATPGHDGSVRLDSFNASVFELAMRKLIGESDGTLVLDMQKVSYISSAGLRVVLIALKELRSQDRQFVLCSLNRPVADVFSISGMTAGVSVCSDRPRRWSI